MANSPEYPDLRWVPPKSYSSGRAAGEPTTIVIHTTEGSAHGTSAEDGAAYDTRRTDGTSAHYFVDSNSVVQCVRTTDRAHTARAAGNKIGIHYELCGRSGSIDWAGDYAQAMLRLAAKQAARDCRRHDIPVRHLTIAQLKAGAKGFVGHADISNAFRQSDHTDPGGRFPWSQFLDLVRAALGQPTKEDDMSAADVTEALKLAENQDRIAKMVWSRDGIIAAPAGSKNADGTPNDEWAAGSYLRNIYTLLTGQTALLKALAAKDAVDEVALARELAPAVAVALVPMLPPGVEVTEQVLADAFRSLLARD